jgi:hypothetical protein
MPNTNVPRVEDLDGPSDAELALLDLVEGPVIEADHDLTVAEIDRMFNGGTRYQVRKARTRARSAYSYAQAAAQVALVATLTALITGRCTFGERT